MAQTNKSPSAMLKYAFDCIKYEWFWNIVLQIIVL